MGKLPVAAGVERLALGVRYVRLAELHLLRIQQDDVDSVALYFHDGALFFPECQMEVAMPDVGTAHPAQVVVRCGFQLDVAELSGTGGKG